VIDGKTFVKKRSGQEISDKKCYNNLEMDERKITIIVFLLSWLVFALSGCAVENDWQVNSDHPSAIIDGDPTNYRSWEGVIGLEFSTPLGTVMCTGVLIDPAIVLTAAHCVYSKDASVDAIEEPQLLRVLGGAKMDIFYSTAAQVTKHPTWEGDIDTLTSVDLALIRLQTPVRSVEYYAIGDTQPSVGDKGKIVGYGLSDFNDESSARVHRVGDTTVLVTDLVGLFEIGGPTSTCMGDSGGPYFSVENGVYRLAGITSFGTDEANCSADADGWNVDLYVYREWIDETTDLLLYKVDQELPGVGGGTQEPKPTSSSSGSVGGGKYVDLWDAGGGSGSKVASDRGDRGNSAVCQSYPARSEPSFLMLILDFL
jgi:hypothetical protein